MNDDTFMEGEMHPGHTAVAAALAVAEAEGASGKAYLTAVVAAQSRAQSLDGARTDANQEQAHEQLNRFLTTGGGYQPQTVQMFH